MDRSWELLPAELERVTELRNRLHAIAEPSGAEHRTRALLHGFFQRHRAAWCGTEHAGGSLSWMLRGREPGPTLVLRCELDGVPLPGDTPGSPVARHRCGHDGHMAMLAGLGLLLLRRPPKRGRVVLLFQAAEENGEGALKVVGDGGFRALQPDLILALHNLPRRPMGQVVLRSGSMCCASRGLEIDLFGRPAHAAQPELGRSPAPVLARLIEVIGQMQAGSDDGGPVCMATLVGARLGERHFGTTPDRALLWVTLRTDADAAMDDLCATIAHKVADLAARHELRFQCHWRDVFPAVVNDAAGCELVRAAACAAGLPSEELTAPFRWSEDFAHYARAGRAVLAGIGSGAHCAPLHDRDYLFPDALLPTGVKLLAGVIAELGMR